MATGWNFFGNPLTCEYQYPLSPQFFSLSFQQAKRSLWCAPALSSKVSILCIKGAQFITLHIRLRTHREQKKEATYAGGKISFYNFITKTPTETITRSNGLDFYFTRWSPYALRCTRSILCEWGTSFWLLQCARRGCLPRAAQAISAFGRKHILSLAFGPN